jgi:GTP-binding protein YchF
VELAYVVKTSLKMNQLPPLVPAVCEFVDIAGLISGAHKGEGLGNRFLSHIRETNAICHVLRNFSDPEVIRQGVSDPKSDFETVETELKLADLQTLEKQKDPGKTQDKELQKRWLVVRKLAEGLSRGVCARDVVLSDDEKKIARELSLLTMKPIIVVLNVDESDLADTNTLEERYAAQLGLEKDQVVAICAKIEAELSLLSDDDQRAYLKDMGLAKSGLERLIQRAFRTLGLVTFLTAGEKEVRAWTIRVGSTAVEAAGVIHSDFMKKFIKADVCDYNDFVEFGGWGACRQAGRVRSEGRDYVMRDGDVVEFRIGS